MRLVDHRAGDRVRLSDGRLVELAWGFWFHGTLKKDQARDPDDKKKVPPCAWFVREIDNDFGGESRSDPFPLSADLAVVELVRKAPVGGGRVFDGGGDDITDPVLRGVRKVRGSAQGGLL